MSTSNKLLEDDVSTHLNWSIDQIAKSTPAEMRLAMQEYVKQQVSQAEANAEDDLESKTGVESPPPQQPPQPLIEQPPQPGPVQPIPQPHSPKPPPQPQPQPPQPQSQPQQARPTQAQPVSAAATPAGVRHLVGLDDEVITVVHIDQIKCCDQAEPASTTATATTTTTAASGAEPASANAKKRRPSRVIRDLEAKFDAITCDVMEALAYLPGSSDFVALYKRSSASATASEKRAMLAYGNGLLDRLLTQAAACQDSARGKTILQEAKPVLACVKELEQNIA